MSLDNHYPNRKDHRRPYRDSRAFDRTCRNNCSCPWCRRRRLYRRMKELQTVNSKLQDYD